MSLRLAVLTACSVLLGLLQPAALAAPPPAPDLGKAIEALAPYEGQSICDPTEKPGVVAFRALVQGQYGGTGGGITRACDVGGRSEHKEGRAWDWPLRADRPADAAKADELLRWLLAPDCYGNANAMARRLGIMYVIWNRQIWSSYAASKGWQAYTGSSPHDGHLHFSFSWAGARQQTSYWNADPVGPGQCLQWAADKPATDRYVTALYRDFLGRTPDEAGLSHWSRAITSGAMSTEQVAYSMASTDEWLGHVVSQMYRDTLEREPDPVGLAHWRDQLRKGMPVAEVAVNFYASQEYFDRMGRDLQVWVQDLYAKLLQRAADPTGLSHWTAESQRAGRAYVARQFYASTETLNRRVQTLYGSLLGRSADPAGLSTWPPVVRDRGDLVLAAFLASSPEYWSRAQ